ncbi:DUF3087 family protein [Thalassotalea sp. G2M2-11]|uniref:DUF3087 family protein n=1 Tax=Thalassotalea sp. G2M2-11 TaxID=2787627 RepID=UPI0019D0B994|nr:DUF3087 family protein [Thalassotalea sp. G2M2-11]
MEIKSIDKAIYRQRLTRVIIGFILVLAVLSLVFGSVMISIFSEQGIKLTAIASQESNNFKYNLLGVILSLLACAAILNSLKNHAYFNEIYYVWQVKQIHNAIYRKLKHIKSAAFNDHNSIAIIVLSYYYATLKQIYFLDDNTLTMSHVSQEANKLQTLIDELSLDIDNETFDKSMINKI